MNGPGNKMYFISCVLHRLIEEDSPLRLEDLLAKPVAANQSTSCRMRNGAKGERGQQSVNK